MPGFQSRSEIQVGENGTVYEFEEHASADGIVYYDADHFPYRGDLLLVQFGNWIGTSVVGRNVLRLQLEPNGETYRGTANPIVERLDRPT